MTEPIREEDIAHTETYVTDSFPNLRISKRKKGGSAS